MTLSEIYIYPIKSLGGIRLEKASVKPKGLEFDRRWMLIGKDGVAMTQRIFPQMALFKVLMDGNRISIDFTRKGQIISSAGFDIRCSTDEAGVKAKVWNDSVDVIESDPSVSKWFSYHLNTQCRLVSFPEENPRAVDPEFSVNHEHVSLADAFPFLIIGQSSLDDLNSRLRQPLPMNRFRPNFIFTGGKAFIEDDWQLFSIGDVRFAAVKKCARCVMTTVDQNTAGKAAEPLKTLSEYRKQDNKIFFGQNLVAFNQGEVATGDPVIPA